MNSVLVECWNCRQKLNIDANRLATARCGKCRQMLVQQVREVQPQENKAYEQAPEKKNQAKITLGTIGVLIAALPLSLIVGGFLGWLVAGILLVVYGMATDMNNVHTLPKTPILYTVAAIIWFFLYWRCVRQGLRELKEGESLFSAIAGAFFEPVKWYPSSKS